jgi:hypothetical protein
LCSGVGLVFGSNYRRRGGGVAIVNNWFNFLLWFAVRHNLSSVHACSWQLPRVAHWATFWGRGAAARNFQGWRWHPRATNRPMQPPRCGAPRHLEGHPKWVKLARNSSSGTPNQYRNKKNISFYCQSSHF